MGSLIPRPLPPKERPDTHCLRIISQVFRGFIKLPYIWYVYVHFTQINGRVTASLDDSLFAEALSCVVLCSKQSCYKLGMKEDKCFCGYQWAFLVNQFVIFLFECKLWKVDTATFEK